MGSYLRLKQQELEETQRLLEQDEDDIDVGPATPSVFNIRRLKLKLRYYLHIASNAPASVISFVKKLIRLLSHPAEFIEFIQEVWDRLKNTPIVVFYSYLWRTNKRQLFNNIFVSYVLPIILESLPWYWASRRKVGSRLRSARNTIQNQMISRKEFSMNVAYSYIGLTALYSILENIDKHLNNRVTLVNRLIVKRLVLEKILYSEIWAFTDYQGRELEYRISNEIHTTIRLFSSTIPKMISSFYAIAREAQDLYEDRDKIDWMSVTLPLFSGVVWKCVDWIKVQIMGRRKSSNVVSTPQVSELFTNVVDGLVDIQLNNLQEIELQSFDKIIQDEFSAWDSLRMFVNRFYNTYTRRGVFDFLSEVYVASLVMDRRNMDFEAYRKVQIDIDHLMKIVKRTGNNALQVKRVIERQNRVVELMRLPNFRDEHKTLPHTVNNLDRLIIEDITFTYSKKQRPPYALNFQGQIIFESRKVYALIGENRSGKSTMVNLITKLYVPLSGRMTFNGIDYSTIQRSSIRDIVSYVAQKPYIFPGTIMENIRVGRPDATEKEVIIAAKLAGIFLHDEKLSAERKCKEQTTTIDSTGSTSSSDQVSNVLETSETDLAVATDDSLTTGQVPADKPKKKGVVTVKRAKKILNGQVQARGGNISGGFAQSIALARVFLRKNSRIVILDESMSAMDPIKKRGYIMPNLLTFVKENGITLILVSHDMSTLSFVDQIIMLETGNIVAQGSHEQLMEQRNAKYRQMIGLSPNL